jgi:hypothetical protein
MAWDASPAKDFSKIAMHGDASRYIRIHGAGYPPGYPPNISGGFVIGKNN